MSTVWWKGGLLLTCLQQKVLEGQITVCCAWWGAAVFAPGGEGWLPIMGELISGGLFSYQETNWESRPSPTPSIGGSLAWTWDKCAGMLVTWVGCKRSRHWAGGAQSKTGQPEWSDHTRSFKQCHELMGSALCTVAQSCPTLCDPMDYRPAGSSVHGIFQARILEQVSISFSRGSSWRPRGQTHIYCASYFGRRILYLHHLGRLN